MSYSSMNTSILSILLVRILFYSVLSTNRLRLRLPHRIIERWSFIWVHFYCVALIGVLYLSLILESNHFDVVVVSREITVYNTSIECKGVILLQVSHFDYVATIENVSEKGYQQDHDASWCQIAIGYLKLCRWDEWWKSYYR